MKKDNINKTERRKAKKIIATRENEQQQEETME